MTGQPVKISSVLDISGRDLIAMEAVGFFMLIALNSINQWMGNLFYRKQATSDIKNMRFSEMKYWNEWHELIANEESKTTCHNCKHRYDASKNDKCPRCGK